MLDKMINQIDNNFVDNYDILNKYKNNIDDVLYRMGFSKFNSYNDFCFILRSNMLDDIKNSKHLNYDDILSKMINKSIRDKIKMDDDYKDKIMVYFNDKGPIKIIERDQ